MEFCESGGTRWKLWIVFPLCLCVSVVNAFSSNADWPTARGNPQRTGCVDNQAGPATPNIVWVYKSQDHFIASPVPAGDRLFVAGLGGFNVPTVSALPTEAKGAPAPLWIRSGNAVRMPVVSSPAVADGVLVFGGGMHQDNGGALFCFRQDGFPLWQLPMPGNLYHLEGAPAFAGKRAYIGGGSGGVICVERERVTLDGKELDTPAMQKALDAKWKELLAKYEEDKKKDPDLARKPSEDELPKPAPIKVWQVGNEKWHVDAPVAVVGDSVLVTSAFLELEKVGDRALFCLDASTGSQRWRQSLLLNPWGGPSVHEKTIVVCGSSVNYDPKSLTGAKGDISAFDLATGKPMWRKEIPGGVVACAALADGLAICCATDGKVRAFDLASGERRWIYDAKAPLFAPPAVAAGVAYAGDLKGVVHAIALADGKAKWRLDLAADAAVKMPGMIYAGPVLQGGKLFVATCNLEGANSRQPTVVVCIGTK